MGTASSNRQLNSTYRLKEITEPKILYEIIMCLIKDSLI